MALLGIKSLVFGVDDLEACQRFYDEFGLELAERTEGMSRYQLAEGSSFILRRGDDPALPAPFLNGPGPREVIWGVDSQASLDALVADLKRDRVVETDAQGIAHTRDDSGIAIGLAVFDRTPVAATAPPTENAPDRVTRLDQHRRWYDRARPKVINHVVFGVPNIDQAVAFYTGRLGFKVSDIMRGLGFFLRCDGKRDHHNLFLLNLPRLVFSHLSFGVENIDELMTGANRMQRAGWGSDNGLGRHRASSMIFFYMNSPAGGQTEYSADGDYVTDAWKPRLWDPEYANHHWLASGTGEPRGAVEIWEGGEIPKIADTVRPAPA